MSFRAPTHRREAGRRLTFDDERPLGQKSPSLPSARVSFVRALYDLFYISLVRFKPKARAFAWNLVAANTAGLLFLPRVEPVVLWISIVTGLVFMGPVVPKGWVRATSRGGPRLVALRRAVARFPVDEPSSESGGWFEAWLGWVIVTDTISLVLDARDAMAFLAGDRTTYF